MKGRELKRIKELPAADRPREKLIQKGPAALTDSELLAILLRTGSRGKSALALASEILKEFNGLQGLTRASLRELTSIKGLGTAKAVTLAAALELARRASRREVRRITSPEEAFSVLKPLFGHKEVEHFGVVTLAGNGVLLGIHEVAKGAVNAAAITPKEVFRPAVRDLAEAVILFHNHPNGDPSPSAQDLKVTERLIEAGKVLGIEVLDHLIVTEETFFSFKGEGLV